MRTAGYLSCNNKNCEQHNKRLLLKRPEVEQYFPKYEDVPNSFKIRKVSNALKPWPTCEKCGKSMSLCDYRTQANINKAIFLG